MKNSLIACLLLCFSLSYAQDLFVSDGSYVYVDGTAFTSGPKVAPLYVTDDINLEINGHIYLRNEAQLVQGNDVGNSGIGQLSVYQTGTVNAYAYNYWCSPVGYVLESDSSAPLNTTINNDFKPNAGIFEVTGTITSTIANYTTSYEGTVSPFAISERWIYSYNAGNPSEPNDYVDWDYIGPNGTTMPAHGFIMKGTGTLATGSQLYDFRGKPNNGEMTAAIKEGEFTLVGNPYPSALDALEFIHDPLNSGLADVEDGATPTPGMSGVLYYWEQKEGAASHFVNQYVGGYATYTISTLVSGAVESFISAPFNTYNSDGTENTPGTPGVDGNKEAFRYIPIGQGFMVEGAADGNVIFKNSHRSYYKQSGDDSYFFRNNNSSENQNTTGDDTQYDAFGNNIVPNDFKRFRLNVDFNNNNSDYTRQLLMNFHHTATDGFDYGLEAKSASDGTNSDAHWILGDDAYTIQAFSFDESLRIPLVVNVNEQQPLRFRIFDIQNFEESQGIYVHDIETNTYVNLRNQNYELNIEPGNYTDRFEIVFTADAALDVDEFDSSTLTINQNNSMHKLSVLNPKNLDITAIEVYDIAGKRLLHGIYDATLNRYELSTTSLSDGVYVVNVKSDANAVKSQKIIVKN